MPNPIVPSSQIAAIPQSDLQIQMGHPLAQNLIGVYLPNSGGYVGNLLDGQRAAMVNGAILDVFAGAHGIECNANNAGVKIPTVNAMMKPQRWSYFWRGVSLGNGTASATVVANVHADAEASPFINFGVLRQGTTETTVRFSWNNTGFRTSDQANGFRTGSPSSLGMTYGSAIVRMFISGRQVATSAFVGTVAYVDSSHIGIGRYAEITNRNAAALTELWYVWNRELLPGEMQQLDIDPYAFLTPATMHRWYAQTVVAGPGVFSPFIRLPLLGVG